MLSHPSCNLDTHQMIKLQRVGTLTTIPREFNEEEKKKQAVLFKPSWPILPTTSPREWIICLLCVQCWHKLEHPATILKWFRFTRIMSLYQCKQKSTHPYSNDRLMWNTKKLDEEKSFPNFFPSSIWTIARTIQLRGENKCVRGSKNNAVAQAFITGDVAVFRINQSH